MNTYLLMITFRVWLLEIALSGFNYFVLMNRVYAPRLGEPSPAAAEPQGFTFQRIRTCPHPAIGGRTDATTCPCGHDLTDPVAKGGES